MKFCSLCYGNVEVVEDAHVCKRCGSIFDTQGELVERRNAHIAPEVAAAIDAGALPLETVDGQVSAIDVSGVTTQEQAQRVAMRDLKPRYRLRTDGSDWLDYAVTPEETAQREAHFAAIADAVSITFKRCTDDGSPVSPQGHRLAYGGVPGCWRVKPEDFPASDGSGSHEAT